MDIKDIPLVSSLKRENGSIFALFQLQYKPTKLGGSTTTTTTTTTKPFVPSI